MTVACRGISPVRRTGYSGARAGNMLFADNCPSSVGSREAAVLRGVYSRTPPTTLDQATLFAGTMPVATATERDVEGTTHLGRLPDPNYAPRVRVERLIATGRVVLAAFSLLAVWIAPSTRGRYAEFTTLRSEEHTSELQSQSNLVCRLLLEKKKNIYTII